MIRPIRMALIGLGKQTRENHIPALREAEDVVLDSVCDIDLDLAYAIGKEHHVQAFNDLDELIEVRDIDAAIVCVPHAHYVPIVRQLAAKGIHVLNEKPFAMNMAEAVELHTVVQDSGIVFMVTLVRRYHPIYSAFEQLSKRIGDVHTIEGRYTMNIQRLDEGWRSKKQLAGGGAVLDMGYHAIDLLVWYFGLPTRVAASVGMGAREEQSYDVEDTGLIHFSYDATGDRPPIMGNLVISRAFPEKEERIFIVGSRGTIVIERGGIRRLSESGEIVESMSREGTWLSANIDQIEYFCTQIRGRDRVSRPPYLDHFDHISMGAVGAPVLEPRTHADGVLRSGCTGRGMVC